jgi:hypothetical protein
MPLESIKWLNDQQSSYELKNDGIGVPICRRMAQCKQFPNMKAGFLF